MDKLKRDVEAECHADICGECTDGVEGADAWWLFLACGDGCWTLEVVLILGLSKFFDAEWTIVADVCKSVFCFLDSALSLNWLIIAGNNLGGFGTFSVYWKGFKFEYIFLRMKSGLY